MSGYYGHTTPTDVEELWDEVRKLRSRVDALERHRHAGHPDNRTGQPIPESEGEWYSRMNDLPQKGDS